MTLSTEGGEIKLTDPNDSASNTTEVVVDIFEDGSGANILGKSGAVNSTFEFTI